MPYLLPIDPQAAFVTLPRDAADQYGFKLEPGDMAFLPAEGETLGQCIDRCVPGATTCARAVLRGSLQVVPREVTPLAVVTIEKGAAGPAPAPLPAPTPLPPLPESACGCPSSSWWHDDVRCHLPAGHEGHHQGPTVAAAIVWTACGQARTVWEPGRLRTVDWAPRSEHPAPCGCRICSDAPPSQEALDRVFAKAGPEADVSELVKGGFVVSVPTDPLRKGVRRIIAKAGTVEGLAELLGA